MSQHPQIIAIITARGGSKRLPGKNINLIAGKPMIAWTIEAAEQSKECSRIIVSTDDERTRMVARLWGAEVPFIRPDELSTDDAKSIDVVIHAIKELKLERHDYVLLLQPTSPLRTAEDIRDAISIIHIHKSDALVSVTEIPKLANEDMVQEITEEGFLENAFKNKEKSKKIRYMFNGAIYLNRVSSLLDFRTFKPPGTIAYVMPWERSIDVDTKADFLLAQNILNGEL